MSTLPENVQPAPAEGELAFSDDDLNALDEAVCRDPAYNERRLALRRKLLALGKRFAGAKRTPKLGLEARTSLHNPHAFNGNKVRRLWAYVCRDKTEKGRLRRVVGKELASDLDAAYRNAYLCLAVESDLVETSLRIHADAWFDGQNLTRRVKAEGVGELVALLNELDGFRLELADWKGEWRCGALEPSRLEEFFKYYEAGTHALALVRRWPVPKAQPAARAALLAPEAPELLLAELERLVPFYRFAAWSQESDFLFG
ncbi:MAG: hypothetical protein H6828_10880 [Planctomycetes bacterium]|nr:hypothetical protein [Planctomycetota bacterium]